MSLDDSDKPGDAGIQDGDQSGKRGAALAAQTTEVPGSLPDTEEGTEARGRRSLAETGAQFWPP